MLGPTSLPVSLSILTYRFRGVFNTQSEGVDPTGTGRRRFRLRDSHHRGGRLHGQLMHGACADEPERGGNHRIEQRDAELLEVPRLASGRGARQTSDAQGCSTPNAW